MYTASKKNFMVECKNMNKIDIYVVIAFALGILLLLPAYSSSSSTTNVTISASGVVQYSASGPSTPINKAAVVYGAGTLTSGQISYIATHFTLLDTGFDSMSSSQAIKSENPNMIILGYEDLIGVYPGGDNWTQINSNESWFAHDANGSRIQNTAWGWYLMNITNLGWKQFYVSHANSQMNNTVYNGVFADDCWNLMTAPEKKFNRIVPASLVSAWHQDMIVFLQYIKANLLPGKMLIVNTDDWADYDYIDVADGMMIEGYEHAPWSLGTALGGGPSIDVLALESAAGKIVWAESGTNTTGMTQTQIDTMLEYCYCSFLVGMNGPKTYWGWNNGSSYNPFQYSYYPIMDTNIGQPTDAYYSSQNVYMRDFTGGKVLFNPSANSYAVSLGGNYQLLNGTVVSSIGLAPWSGEILLSLT